MSYEKIVTGVEQICNSLLKKFHITTEFRDGIYLVTS